MDKKDIIKLIDKLSLWCKRFKKSLNIIRWSDIKNEIQIELLSNVDFVIENTNSLIVNTNLRDDFDKFIKDVKDLVEGHYYEIIANEDTKKVVLHIKLDETFYKVIKSVLQMRIAGLFVNVYRTPNCIFVVEANFENGYDAIFELQFDDIFDVSIKYTDSEDYLDYSFSYIDSSELFGIIYKLEQLEKGELTDSLDGKELLKKTGLSLKYNED